MRSRCIPSFQKREARAVAMRSIMVVIIHLWRRRRRLLRRRHVVIIEVSLVSRRWRRRVRPRRRLWRRIRRRIPYKNLNLKIKKKTLKKGGDMNESRSKVRLVGCLGVGRSRGRRAGSCSWLLLLLPARLIPSICDFLLFFWG